MFDDYLGCSLGPSIDLGLQQIGASINGQLMHPAVENRGSVSQSECSKVDPGQCLGYLRVGFLDTIERLA